MEGGRDLIQLENNYKMNDVRLQTYKHQKEGRLIKKATKDKQNKKTVFSL